MNRSARFNLVASLFSVGVLLSACGSSSATVSLSSAGGSKPSTGATVTTSSTNASSTTTNLGSSEGAKAPLSGLIDMGYQGPYSTNQPFPPTDPNSLDAYVGAFSGIVVNESWSQLEPSDGVYDWSSLDTSLANVTTWNSQHPSSPLSVKLRIFAGRSAPNWVINLSGPVVTTTAGRHTARTVTVGRFWTTPFRQAWSTFQHAMAARYDTNPLIRAVSVSSCSSSTGEPFVVAVARPSSHAALLAAGWTVQAQESCLQGALADYSGWKLTPVTFAFNPLPLGPGSSQAFTTSIMQECANSAETGGPQCVLGNNALSPLAPSTGVGQTYSEIAALENTSSAIRPAVYFQTVGSALTCSTMSIATTFRAGSVEVWPPFGNSKGFSAIATSTLSLWNQDLVSGRAITC